MDLSSRHTDHTALHIPPPEEKMGLDNPGLALGSKISLPPPPYTEEKSYKNEALSNVYIVQRSEKQPKEKVEYNPYDHRQVKHATTFYETLFHMLKASLGTGILAMPNAFHNAGYLVGIIGTLTIGFLCTYSIHILITAQYELCRRRKKPSMTYPETLEAALAEGPAYARPLAPYADFIANLFLIMYQIGSCCIYSIFVSSNIKDVVEQYNGSQLDLRYYLLILLLPFILINWIRNLKLMAPFSTFANFITVISFCIIGYYILTDIPPISDRAAVATFSHMPLFFGTVLFAMESIGVILPLENEMADPKRFGSFVGVLNCSMLPITVLYTLTGFFGYLKYGTKAAGSITLNLPQDEVLAQVARLLLAFAIYISYGLNCYIAFDIVWNQKLKKHVTNRALFWEYVVRTVLVLIIFFFAVAIPNLELFISLMGALCLSTMGLSFPAIIQMFTFWNFYAGMGKILFFLKNFIVILIAVLGFTVGVSTSLHEIYLKFFVLE